MEMVSLDCTLCMIVQSSLFLMSDKRMLVFQSVFQLDLFRQCLQVFHNTITDTNAHNSQSFTSNESSLPVIFADEFASALVPQDVFGCMLKLGVCPFILK